MKKLILSILSFFLMLSSSFAQMEYWCLDIHQINDTLFAVVKQDSSSHRCETLILNPFKKKVYTKIKTHCDHLVVLKDNIIFLYDNGYYLSTYDYKNPNDSTLTVIFNPFTKKITKKLLDNNRFSTRKYKNNPNQLISNYYVDGAFFIETFDHNLNKLNSKKIDNTKKQVFFLSKYVDTLIAHPYNNIYGQLL